MKLVNRKLTLFSTVIFSGLMMTTVANAYTWYYADVYDVVYPGSRCKYGGPQGQDDYTAYPLRTAIKNDSTATRSILCPMYQRPAPGPAFYFAEVNVSGTSWPATACNVYATDVADRSVVYIGPSPTYSTNSSTGTSKFHWDDWGPDDQYTVIYPVDQAVYAIKCAVPSAQSIYKYEVRTF